MQQSQSRRHRLLAGIVQLIDRAGELKGRFGGNAADFNDPGSWEAYWLFKGVHRCFHHLYSAVRDRFPSEDVDPSTELLASFLTRYRFSDDIALDSRRKAGALKQRLARWVKAGLDEEGRPERGWL